MSRVSVAHLLAIVLIVALLFLAVAVTAQAELTTEVPVRETPEVKQQAVELKDRASGVVEEINKSDFAQVLKNDPTLQKAFSEWKNQKNKQFPDSNQFYGPYITPRDVQVVDQGQEPALVEKDRLTVLREQAARVGQSRLVYAGKLYDVESGNVIQEKRTRCLNVIFNGWVYDCTSRERLRLATREELAAGVTAEEQKAEQQQQQIDAEEEDKIKTIQQEQEKIRLEKEAKDKIEQETKALLEKEAKDREENKNSIRRTFLAQYDQRCVAQCRRNAKCVAISCPLLKTTQPPSGDQPIPEDSTPQLPIDQLKDIKENFANVVHNPDDSLAKFLELAQGKKNE
jgi:hypothetical protein